MSLTATLLLGRPVKLPRGAAIRSHRMSDVDRLPRPSSAPPTRLHKLHNGTFRGVVNRAAVAEALRGGPADVIAIAKASGIGPISTRRWLLDMIECDEATRHRSPDGKKWIYELTEAA